MDKHLLMQAIAIAAKALRQHLASYDPYDLTFDDEAYDRATERIESVIDGLAAECADLQNSIAEAVAPGKGLSIFPRRRLVCTGKTAVLLPEDPEAEPEVASMGMLRALARDRAAVLLLELAQDEGLDPKALTREGVSKVADKVLWDGDDVAIQTARRIVALKAEERAQADDDDDQPDTEAGTGLWCWPGWSVTMEF